MSSTASDSGPRLRFAGARTAFVAVVATALLTIAVWGDSPNRGRPERAAGSGSSTHIGASSVLLVSALAALVAIRTRLGLRSEPRFLAPLLVEAGVRVSRRSASGESVRPAAAGWCAAAARSRTTSPR